MNKDVFRNMIQELDYPDLRNLCQVNKFYWGLCIANEDLVSKIRHDYYYYMKLVEDNDYWHLVIQKITDPDFRRFLKSRPDLMRQKFEEYYGCRKCHSLRVSSEKYQPRYPDEGIVTIKECLECGQK